MLLGQEKLGIRQPGHSSVLPYGFGYLETLTFRTGIEAHNYNPDSGDG